MTPYFIVDREFLDVMRYASERGVEVAMILPGIPDKKVVYYIARTFYPELLKAGIGGILLESPAVAESDGADLPALCAADVEQEKGRKRGIAACDPPKLSVLSHGNGHVIRFFSLHIGDDAAVLRLSGSGEIKRLSVHGDAFDALLHVLRVCDPDM